MNITTTGTAVKQALTLALTTRKKHHHDELNAVQLTADNDGVFLTAVDATDDVRVSVPLAKSNVQSTGTLWVDRAQLENIAKTAKSKELSIWDADNSITISHNGVDSLTPAVERELKANNAAAGRFVRCDAGFFRDAWNRTVYAMAKTDVRYYLNGLLMDFTEDGLFLVATDGHRLARTHIPLDTEQRGQYIIPRDAVLRLAAALKRKTTVGQITIHPTATHTVFTLEDGLTIEAQNISATYPKYETVIPQGGTTVLFERDVLIDRIKSLQAATTNKNPCLVLEFSAGQVRLHISETTADTVIPVDCKFDLKIGVNPQYLLDTLANASQENYVALRVKDANTPFAVEYVHVIMPMRL